MRKSYQSLHLERNDISNARNQCKLENNNNKIYYVHLHKLVDLYRVAQVSINAYLDHIYFIIVIQIYILNIYLQINIEHRGHLHLFA